MLACATAMATLMAAPAWGQTAPKPQSFDGSDQADIIVTAQKRDERLIDTPQSISVLRGSDLEAQGMTQFRDFADTVPGLSYTSFGAGQTQISLRGVTTGIDIGPTVGVYVDEVPYGSSSAFSNASSLALDVGLSDIDRIEVLRGPQGTLYGASTMGGLLKYVSVRPDTTDFAADLRAGIAGTADGGTSYNGSAAVNLPIATGKAALRASGFNSSDAGFTDNLALERDGVNRARIYGGRLDLLLTPTDRFAIRIVAFLQNIDREGTSAADYLFTGRPVDGALDQRRLIAEPYRNRFRLISGTLSYDVGAATITSISSYQTSDIRFVQDASALYVPSFAAAGIDLGKAGVDQARGTDKFTQEVRISSDGETRLQWLVGGFYTSEKAYNNQHIAAFLPDGTPFPLDLATVAIPSRYEEVAAFGNLTWRLTDKFDVSGGLRYARNSQSFQQIGSGLLIGSQPKQRATDEVVTYLANARYRFSPQATAYLRYATGYRPGGPNYVVNDPLTGLPLAPATFASDSLQSYEMGFKGETADRTLAVDLSAYHIDWKDIQVSYAAGGVSVIGNAGRAQVDGAEATLTARPAREFTASAALAFQNARVRDASPDLGAAAGERLPNVPRISTAVTLDYRARAGNLRPTAGATLRMISDRRVSFDGSLGFPQYRLPPYALLDLRAGMSAGPVTLTAYVRNVFDARAQLSGQTVLSSAGGPAQITIAQPRTIGLVATARF
jgi:outer membrane receptor protein involved in Fe transport